MGLTQDYPNVPDWVAKSEGYQTGAMVKYKGNIFYANFWASEPGVGDADHNGWRFYDELYDQTPHTPTAQAKIIAYIPTWRKSENFNYANDEIYQYITHGIIAFLMFSETTLGEFDPASVNAVAAVISDVVETGHRNGTRILIALGGATDFGFLALMTAVGNNAGNPLLDTAVKNVVDFVQANDLDGVDLDLECWWGKPGETDQGGRVKSEGPHPAGYALTFFAQKLKQAMPDKLVSATLFGTSWYGNNYDPTLAAYVDWLAVMTYDLTGSWSASPVGPHTALSKIRTQDSSTIRSQEYYQESYLPEQQGEWPGGGIVNNPILSVEDTLWYWTNPLFVNWQGAGQNIPRNKTAAGVPLYGYDFAYAKDPDAQSGQVPPGYKVIQYKDILAQFPAAIAVNGNIKVAGNTPRPSFVSAPGNYPYAHNIYLETPDTGVAKLNFLKSVGAQGVIIWEISNDVWEDNQSIIKALYNNSGNSEKAPISQPKGASIDIVYNGDTNNFDVNFSLGPAQKTIFLIHGWNSGPNRAFGDKGAAGSLDTELLSIYPNANIIRVDWTQKADTWFYPDAAGQVSYVAQALAQVFATLRINPNDTNVIGHSLGAHLAGFASNNYRQSTGNYIGEIVGLDPAAPFSEWYNNGFNSGLASTHAQRVVVIHSSNSGDLPPGGYGNFAEIGTLDIYIKSGSDIYGLTGPNDHDLAITIYQSLVTGQSYPGVNRLAVVEIQTPPAPLPTPQLPPPTDEAAPDSDFTDVFNLSQLDNADLKGDYTIDYGRPFASHSP